MDPNSKLPNNNPPEPSWSPPSSTPNPGSDPASQVPDIAPAPAAPVTPIPDAGTVQSVPEPVTVSWTPAGGGVSSSLVPEPAMATATTWPAVTSSPAPASPQSMPSATPTEPAMAAPTEPFGGPIPTFTPAPTPTAESLPMTPASFSAPPTPSWMSAPGADIAPPSPVLDQSGATVPFGGLGPAATETSSPVTAAAESSAPTDLSQLIDNTSASVAVESNPQAEVSPTPVETSSAETIVASSVSNPVSAAEPHKGFPKIMLIIAAVVLMLVVGAASYFFVFNPQQKSTSLPAEQQTQQPLTNPPKQAEAPESAPVQPPPASPSAATFGNLAGSTSSAHTATSSASAIELLRQRQAAGR